MCPSAETRTEAAPHGGAYTDFPSAPGEFDSAGCGTALARLFKSAVAHAQDRIDWYDRKAGLQQRKAKSLRFWSIMFFSVGTGAPLVMATALRFSSPDIAAWPIAEIGYLFLAVAGALVLFDQFFQYSASWMRYRQAQSHLEVLLADFRYDWNAQLARFGGVIADTATAEDCVRRLGKFVGDIERASEIETREWATQFNASIVAFDKDLSGKRGGVDGGDQKRDSGSAGGNGSATGGPGSAPPTGATARIRLGIEGIDQLTQLALTADEKPVAVPPDGVVELPLEIGKQHEIQAEALRNGIRVRAAATLTPDAAGDGTPVLLQLV